MNSKLSFSQEFFRKTFTADTRKNAYMSAVKWFAINVLSKDELNRVHAEFIKDPQSPSVTLHLFAVLDREKEIMDDHCTRCREMHKSFFINEDTACNRCSALGFQKRLEEKMSIKRTYYRELLRRYGGIEE